MVLLIQSVKIFLRKASYALALSFTGLSGLVKPFVSQVHHDKNHWGQIVFADLMYRILHLNKQVIVS